jgi:hypothetical protein
VWRTGHEDTCCEDEMEAHEYVWVGGGAVGTRPRAESCP